MECNSKPFTQIDRNYTITSKELRKFLGLKGEITSMGLLSGRSPNDLSESSEKDKWYITTQERRTD